MSCKNCLRWKKDIEPESKEGQCRRHPPVPLIITKINPLTKGIDSAMQAFFPRTREDIKCEEFLPALSIEKN